MGVNILGVYQLKEILQAERITVAVIAEGKHIKRTGTAKCQFRSVKASTRSEENTAESFRRCQGNACY
jgi:hypothetical protein